MSDNAIGQIVLFLTTVVGFAIQIYRENRNRQWSLEDRRKVAADLAVTTGEATDKIQAQIADLSGNVQQGNVHAPAAYKEANDVNVKIADLQKALVKQGDVCD